MKNTMKIQFLSKSENEAFARVAVAAFVSQLDPTLDVISDIKTAVSEGVTNAIIHGYEGRDDEEVYIECELEDDRLTIKIIDNGVGIKNIEEAKEPLYTSRPDLERSGMGFTLMETFMDEMEVSSREGQGTVITLRKTI
ncbi:putative anti-sigma regulatory factor [Clostridium bornimense]|uniref:Anti-sigma F factor n=1 Tax=Clostridium bornimense TaxID=1216932 RepID=W6S4C3_9CLOT|nr:anti-sigma F factor [Clostridium bornimense]CDM69192.1 putative anti-sigma regulatory factor [Clostridium bornimense]